MIAKILLGLWGFSQKHMKLVFAIAAILLVVTIIGATRVESSSQYSEYLPKDSQTYKNIVKLEENFSSDQLIVVIEGDSVSQIVSDKNLAAMKYFDDQLAPEKNVQYVLTPEYMIELAKSMSGGADPNTPNEQWLTDPKTGKLTLMASYVFFNPTTARIVEGVKGGISPDEKHELIEKTKRVVKEAGFENVKLTVSGSPMVNDYTSRQCTKTVFKILPFAAIAMLIILGLLLRTRGFFGWRYLTLGLIGGAVIYLMGIMGLANMHITMVSTAVFPIVLGLGMDYAIQFYNRYDEENRKGLSAAQSVSNTFEHIGPPLVIAMLVACAAFASVFLSKTPMIREFGIMLIVGILICLAVCVMLLLPLLYLRDRRHDATNKPDVQEDSSIDKAARVIAHASVKYLLVILVIAVGFASYGWAEGHTLKGNVGYDTSLLKTKQVRKDLDKVVALAGGATPGDVMITAPDVLDPTIMQWMLDHETHLMATTRVDDPNNPGHYTGSVQSIADLYISSFGSLPKDTKTAEAMLTMIPQKFWVNFVSPDHTQAHIVLFCSTSNTKKYSVFQDDVEKEFANPPQGSTVTVAGQGTLIINMADDLNNSRTTLTYLGLGFIFAMMLICFKFKVSRVITAALPIVFILGWSTAIMVIKGLDVTILCALMPAQVMGIGVEFTVLLLLRYYEEREKGGIPMDCMVTAMSRIGRAIIVSGLMVIVGFGSLYFARAFPLMVDFGFTTTIDMVLILLSTLLILPGMVITWDSWRDSKKKVAEPVK